MVADDGGGRLPRCGYAGFTVALWALLTVVAEGSATAANVAVVSMHVDAASLKAHGTNLYDLRTGFAVRRGAAFNLTVTTSAAVPEGGSITLREACAQPCYGPGFRTTRVRRVSPVVYEITLTTDVVTAVGRYDAVVVEVVGAGSKALGPAYAYPEPVYILFNPLSPADHEVYVADQQLLDENLAAQYGLVAQGTAESYATTVWYYGHHEQVVLDAACDLLRAFIEARDRGSAASVEKVLRTISRNQGMTRAPDGTIESGSEGAILEGNWGEFPMNATTDPEVWTAIPDIVRRWRETGRPTQYGQCWVFAALETGLLRSLGLVARQVTAFGSVVDSSWRHDRTRRLHHVVDVYISGDGERVYTDGRLWNFHSWTDVMVDLEGGATRPPASHWHLIDGTPSGLGPVSVNAILALNDSSNSDAQVAISDVHSTIRQFLVRCSPVWPFAAHPLDGCDVRDVLAYDSRGLEVIVTSCRRDENLGLRHITAEYVNHTRDAFIPYDNTTVAGRLPVRERLQDSGEILITPAARRITVGSAVTGHVAVHSPDAPPGTPVDIRVSLALENRGGDVLKRLGSQHHVVRTDSTGRASVNYSVAADTYASAGTLRDRYVRITALAYAFDQRVMWVASRVQQLLAPQLVVDVPQTVVRSAVDGDAAPPLRVAATFTNPHNRQLPRVCMTLHAHAGRLHGSDDAREVRCAALGAGSAVEHNFAIAVPRVAGLHYVAVTVHGSGLPVAHAHAAVRVLE